MNEFELIRHHFADWPADAAVRLGVGDDAALWSPPAGADLVLCADTLVAGRHFPEHTDAHAIGWKALAVNLSDLAAMGARPRAFLLALTLPEFDAGWLEGFASGLRELAGQHAVALIGGDTTRGPLSISITALGEVPAGLGLRRAGAQAGDCVVVSGELGAAAAALPLGESAPNAWRRRLDYPEARVELGQQLLGQATAAIDISDGLLADLGHLLEASDVAAQIDFSRIPSASDLAQKLSAEQLRDAVLAGGDDYELCFTVPQDRLAELQASSPLRLTAIGHITPPATGGVPRLTVLGADGAKLATPQTGFQHF